MGGGFLRLLSYLGQLGELFLETTLAFFVGKIRPNLVGRQVVNTGFGSQLVVIVTGAFTGAVFAAQTYFKFSTLGLESAVGPVVSIAMCRELGPVLTGLMVAGRVGAAMAAEIGTMKVTEQIDALRSIGVHPLDYLVLPRAAGMFFSMPLLVAEATGFGIVASYVITVWGFKVPFAWYDAQIRAFTDLSDIGIGMIKGFFFGGIIVLVSCHQGLTASNGAVGVGRGTTSAVVISSLGILIVNFFLSLLLNYFFPLSAQA
ncbi:MAG: ABC transporter permease [Verrucomicrobiae bacterium]|nr:ABC transporter permease [Verrucomicrobiae bacterium]MCP5539243.1 ABC transporter permease [Akkermansiaceae bacterium]